MANRRLMATHDVGDRIPLPGGYWLEKASDDKWWFGQGQMNIALAIETSIPCGPDGSIDASIVELAAAFNGAQRGTDADFEGVIGRLVDATGGCGSVQDLRAAFGAIFSEECSVWTALLLRTEVTRLSNARAGDQQRLAHYEAVLLSRGRGDVVADEVPTKADMQDARRYRRLRILGCRLDETEPVEPISTHGGYLQIPAYGALLRFQNLDAYLDDDLQRQPDRGEARGRNRP